MKIRPTPFAFCPLLICGGLLAFAYVCRAGGVLTWGNIAVPPASASSNVVALAGGQFFSIALKNNGTVVGWGSDCCGQTDPPANLTNAVKIAAGYWHGAALKSNGTVVAWGSNNGGQLDVPAGLTNVVAIAAGGAGFNLALKSDGKVVAWGDNYWGECNVPSSVTNAVAVAAGYFCGLAILSDGTVIAWGDNSYGQLNIPTNLTNAVAIAGAERHVAVLKADGTVIAWGDNSYGQCNVPAGLSHVTNLVAGGLVNLAQTSDGRIFAWGDNNSGESTLPAGLNSVSALGAGVWFSEAVVDLDHATPILQQQPVNISVYEGDATNFSAAANGATPLGWQWYFENALVADATNASLAFTNLTPAQTGNYFVVVSNSFGSLTSIVAHLTVALPAITTNPTNRVANAGSSTTFIVAANGTALSYQWQFNGTNLLDATNTTLTLNSVTTNDAGIYQALVSNGYRVLQSSNAQLDVVTLTINPQPVSRVVYSGDSTTFSIAVQGTGPFTYQWIFKGTNVPGATNASFTLSNVTNSQVGIYSVIVGNIYGTVSSADASLTVVNSKPIIATQPANKGGSAGGNASFQVVADGSKPLSYQWLFNGTNISSATNTTLTLTNLTSANAGNYSVLVSNPVGSTLSSNAALVFLNVVTWGQTNNFGLNLVPLDLTNAIAVAVGDSHSVALKSNGKVVVWGGNFNNQTNVPASASNVIAIAAAYNHTLVVRSNGTVVAWGSGGTNVPAGLSNVIAVAAGQYHSMALKTNGTVIAWGDGSFVNTATTNVPASATNIVAIAAGNNFCVALKQNGTIVTWGTSYSFPGITNAVAIAASEFPIVVLKADGRVFSTNAFAASPGLSNAVGVAAQRYTVSALKSDGTVTNWGSGGPVTPAGLSNVTVLVSGQYVCLAILGSPQSVQIPFTNLKRISNSFSISLPAQIGHVYCLEYKNSLSDSNWTALPLAAGNGDVLTLTNTGVTNSQRFYRVRQW